MEKELGMCGAVSTGSGLSCVTHTTKTHIMKSHKDLKEQSAFVLALLNRPNPHMLFCTIQL